MTNRQTAFITGAASGIGHAAAVRLAADGFRVVILDRDHEKVERSVAALRASGHDAAGHALDVRDRAAIAQALDSQPRVDVLVCAAGIGPMRAFDEITDDDFRQVLEVNLIGLFACCQEAARRMQADGRIVTVSSRAALGAGSFAHYAASKAGVIGLTRAMAIDLRPKGIAVNSIAPGFTDTGMTRALTPQQHAAASALEPAGKPADPSEIANAIAFFASPRTTFVTGQTLFVDGGKSLGGLGA